MKGSKVKKLKKGDLIKIVAGRDKGKEGKIEKVLSKENKVFVAGANLYKRHLKSRSASKPSEIATITKPLPISNTMLICPKCKATTRIGFIIGQDKKRRICRKCEQEI